MGKREGGHRAHRISSAVSDLPLWPSEAPEWARIAWAHLKATLPQGRDRDVWIDWYEERLRGGLRGEEYELVFAKVPQGNGTGDRRRLKRGLEHICRDPRATTSRREIVSSSRRPSIRFVLRTAGSSSRRRTRGQKIKKPHEILSTSHGAKRRELRERLVRVQVDTRLQRTVGLLDDRLTPPIESIRVGLVLSSLRSLESDARAYDSEEGRKEHAPDLIAALDDLAGTVRDFASQFPRSHEILANQIALELVEERRRSNPRSKQAKASPSSLSPIQKL
jgi:hypothetical protein